MAIQYKRKTLSVSEKLIKQVANRDPYAFETLYDKTSGAVFGLAMSILSNQADAEDVVQETYISIYKHAENYSRMGKPMAWIFTIARNHALMKIRERTKKDTVNLDTIYDVGEDSTVEKEMNNNELIEVLLKTLKEEDRQIVVMHAMSNLKHKDIARIMEIPLSTILSKYRRALEKLRLVMEVNGYEE